MLVFGMGLYELFVSNLDHAKSLPGGRNKYRSSLFGLFPLQVSLFLFIYEINFHSAVMPKKLFLWIVFWTKRNFFLHGTLKMKIVLYSFLHGKDLGVGLFCFCRLKDGYIFWTHFTSLNTQYLLFLYFVPFLPLTYRHGRHG